MASGGGLSAIESLKSSFSSYAKNIAGYAISSLVFWVWLMVAVGLPFGLFALSMLLIGALSGGDIASALMSNLLLSIIFLFWLLLILLLHAFFVGGGIGSFFNACHSISSGKTPTILGNIEYGIKNGGRFTALVLIYYALAALFFAPAALSYVFLHNNIVSLVLLLGGFGAIAISKFFFAFSFPSAAMENATPLGSLLRSARFVLSNPLQCVIFDLVLSILCGVLGFIPLVNMFVLAPIAFTALCLFYKHKR